MPKSFQQKLKILYLMRVFSEKTDEAHPMSVKDLISYLESLGIHAERKTIYDDIETLRVFGMDIMNRRERPSGFYLASREFETAELKLLVDAVQSSRFLTVGKSRQLIQKLEPPCSEETDLFDAAIKAGPDKIIVKRPLKSEFLAGRKPSYTLNGKAIRYDCYTL